MLKDFLNSSDILPSSLEDIFRKDGYVLDSVLLRLDRDVLGAIYVVLGIPSHDDARKTAIVLVKDWGCYQNGGYHVHVDNLKLFFGVPNKFTAQCKFSLIY